MIKIRQQQYKRLKFQVLLLQFHGTMTSTFLRKLTNQETQFICLGLHMFSRCLLMQFYHNRVCITTWQMVITFQMFLTIESTNWMTLHLSHWLIGQTLAMLFFQESVINQTFNMHHLPFWMNAAHNLEEYDHADVQELPTGMPLFQLWHK